MSEGWLFRLRTSLGAGQTAPTWPDAPAAPRDSDVPCLRRAAASTAGPDDAPAVPADAVDDRQD